MRIVTVGCVSPSAWEATQNSRLVWSCAMRPSGVTSTAPVIGAFDGRVRAQADRVRLTAPRGTGAAAFTITYAVGGFSGWHSHPGIVVAVVQQGTVVRQVGCRSETFGAGQAFTEVGTHHVRNLYTDAAQPGAEPAVLAITQLYPGAAPARRIEQDPPDCG